MIGVAPRWDPPSWPVMVRLLGQPQAIRDGTPLALSPAQLSALSFLAIERDVSIVTFAGALWPEHLEVTDTHRHVRQFLFALGKATGGEQVVSRVHDDRVRARADLSSDLAIFEALNRRAHEAPDEWVGRYHQMVDLLRGVPFAVGDAVAHYWRWTHVRELRAEWERRAARVAGELARLYLDAGDRAVARDIAVRGVQANPWDPELGRVWIAAEEGLRA